MSAEAGDNSDMQQFAMLNTLDQVKDAVITGNISSLVIIMVKRDEDGNRDGDCHVLMDDPYVVVGIMEELKHDIFSQGGA